jgi:hypothetical protein
MTEVGGKVEPSLEIIAADSLVRNVIPDINSPQGWFAHEGLVSDTELSLLDKRGRDAAGKVILTLIAIVFLLTMYCLLSACLGHCQAYDGCSQVFHCPSFRNHAPNRRLTLLLCISWARVLVLRI